MIGQHIYSRCTEGYFSRSGSKGDSTTVTISRDMFAREDQAKLVARECEAVGTLEDIRPVPSEITGTYRGVLKIKRLNQQLTVVSRAYRLKAEGNMSGERSSGEFRDFTYSSSYILAEEDKGRFLREPEYALNLQNFEPYPSVQARIEESKRNGARGRIEANPEYSLFKNPQKKTEISVFERAGFTQELFIDYISSIVQRVGYMDYRGHENDKVLVVLPDQFRPAWNATGGNGYAEQIIAATLKVLPDFISQNISAVSCGGANPEASVLKGYQLIFMESGFAKEWVNSEYSIIDLQNKKSYVSGDLDTSYGRFIWDTLQKEEEKADEEVAAGIDIEAKPEISYDDFMKMQFQVGEIISCEAVPKSKKLLCSQVKIGSQVKQIVSGIRKYYTPEEMVGKKVMVLVNLKPAKLAGVLSEGMLLCAEDAEGNLALMTPEKAMPSGAEIC